jgi:transcriptional regulator with XRE-family HTH domain
MTQGQLAAAVGVSSPMAVSRWETGVHKPSDISLMKLAAVFRCEPAWFYTDHKERAA